MFSRRQGSALGRTQSPTTIPSAPTPNASSPPSSGSPSTVAEDPLRRFFLGGGECFSLQPEEMKSAIIRSIGESYSIRALKLSQITAIIYYLNHKRELRDFVLKMRELTPSDFFSLGETGRLSLYTDFLSSLSPLKEQIRKTIIQSIAILSLRYLTGLKAPLTRSDLTTIYKILLSLDVNDAAYDSVLIDLCSNFRNIEIVLSTGIPHFKTFIFDHIGIIVSRPEKKFEIDVTDAGRLVQTLESLKLGGLTTEQKALIIAAVPPPPPASMHIVAPHDDESTAHGATDWGPSPY